MRSEKWWCPYNCRGWIVCSVGLLAVGTVTSLLGFARADNQVHSYSISANGTFSAENGLFFAEESRIHMYSQLPMVENPKTSKRELTPLGDELRTQWKGQPYYHEIYQLTNGKWVRIRRTFSEAPNTYLDFGPCDPLNQLDISLQHSELKPFLPSAMLMKAVTEVDDEDHYFVVVFSDAPDARVRYRLKIALISAQGETLSLQGTQDIGDYGQFCGTRALGDAKLLDGQTAIDVLVYTLESGGSGENIAVHSYLVKRVGGPVK
jgi:hypothetical protein